jgi:FkbM family methyltransferase
MRGPKLYAFFYCRKNTTMFKLFKKKKDVTKIFGNVPMEELLKQKYGVKGSIQVDGKDFEFHDARCFYDTWQELIVNKMYEFDSSSSAPYILDCGANLGLSVFYFSKLYPNAVIDAFEPEPPIFEVLKNNVATYQLKNVIIHKKAVWDSETTLKFYTDHGMGGSVTNVYSKQEPTIIETLKLADFMQKKVDMLKMDIEGAEFTVLKSCESLLKNVEHLFVEYHSFINKEQQLDDLLALLKRAGFRYHLKESFSMKRPFIERNFACENMDMAINIFAYRDK